MIELPLPAKYCKPDAGSPFTSACAGMATCSAILHRQTHYRRHACDSVRILTIALCASRIRPFRRSSVRARLGVEVQAHEKLHIVLAEGLSQDAGKQYHERRRQEELILYDRKRLECEIRNREEVGGKDKKIALLTDDDRLRLRELDLQLNFLRGLDFALENAAHDFKGQTKQCVMEPSRSSHPVHHEPDPCLRQEVDADLVPHQVFGQKAVIPADVWNGLLDDEDSVFLEHGFLSGLEDTGCVTLDQGWQPRFLLAWCGAVGTKAGRLVGAIPMYAKQHSRGEFCEEFEWFRASCRLSINPWPRLFVGVPFTPHRGRRLVIAANLMPSERDRVRNLLLRSLLQVASLAKWSVNVAFCSEDEFNFFSNAAFIRRDAMQTCWVNRFPERYKDFSEFLGSLRKKNAQNIMRQRAEINEHRFLRVEIIDGSQDPSLITPEIMTDVFDKCYASTQALHDNGEGGSFELNRLFFLSSLPTSLPIAFS